MLMPSEPNFKCSGLVTVAPFLGSTKNTRFLPADFAGACAATNATPTPTVSTNAVASHLRMFISVSLASILADAAAAKPTSTARFFEFSAASIQRKHTGCDRGRKKWIGRQRDNRCGPLRGKVSDLLAERTRRVAGHVGACVL